MRTFSGYTSVFWAYNHVLSVESKAILSSSAFGHVIEAWHDIDRVNPTTNLMLLCAFLDRYWDTTNTFHLPGFEAGISFSGFGMVSGFPCGETPIDWDFQPPLITSREVIDLIGDVLDPLPVNRSKAPFLIKTICILDYFQGKGKGKVDPRKGNPRQNARLWLWWFQGAIFLRDKGERVTTQILRYLVDLDRLGDYDWVTPALGLTIKYWRDAIHLDKVDSTSQPSLVFPGVIMETRDSVLRRDQFREGESDSLLLPGADYTVFAWSRLAIGPIEAIDPDLEHQPPDFPVDVEYEDGEDEDVRHTYALPPAFSLETDIGMDSWVAKVKKVAGGVHKKLWRTANRWRAAAARLSTTLCQSRRETEAMRREAETIRREYDEYRAAHP